MTDYVHLDLPDMRLDTLQVEINRVVENHIADFSPQVVYTPHPDVNRDHRVLFDSVAVATRPTPGQPVRRVLTYAPTSSTEWTPAPQLVRPELVRGHLEDDRAQGRRVRALRQNARVSAPRASGRFALPRSSTARAVVASTPSRSCSSAASCRLNDHAMARWPQLLVVLALLAATAAAFAVTERLSSSGARSLARASTVSSLRFASARDVAVISIVLRRRETVTLDILNRDGHSIRTIVRKRREAAGRVFYIWDGRDNSDRVVPEGVYGLVSSSSATDARSCRRTRCVWTRPRRRSGSSVSSRACSRPTPTGAAIA